MQSLSLEKRVRRKLKNIPFKNWCCLLFSSQEFLMRWDNSLFYYIVLLGTILVCHYLETWQTALLSRREHLESSHIHHLYLCSSMCYFNHGDVWDLAFRGSTSENHRVYSAVVHEEILNLLSWNVEKSCFKILDLHQNKSLVLWLNRRNLSSRFCDILPNQTKK